MLGRVVGRFTLPVLLADISSIGLAIGAMPQTSGKMANEQAGASKKLALADRQFIRNAAEGGLAEIELGKLATEKAASPEVKQFGQRMVDDHTKANDQLKQVASEKGVTIQEKLSPQDAATKARLEKLSGKAFDHAFMQVMVADHVKAVSAFRTESKTGKDPDVKNFASQTLPTLEDHLKQAKSIAPKTGKQMSQQNGTH